MESILTFVPAVMGLGFIDENLQDLLNAMDSYQPDLGLGTIMWYARSIGCCLALGVGANECYQMILGRRGMDVMKILHIIIISFCITFAPTVASMAKRPGLALEEIAWAQVQGFTDTIDALQEDVSAKQKEYLTAIRDRQLELQEERQAKNESEDNGWLAELGEKVEEVVHVMMDKLSYMALLAEQQICEWLNIIIRYIGELIFQVIIYGTLLAQRIFLNILGQFAPLMFALSLSPHFKSAWSQWLSKYLSVSLWGFVCYVCVYYALRVIQYNLIQDIAGFDQLMQNVSDSNLDNLAVMGMQSLGSTCMYVVGCLVGVKCLAMVPEVCSWLIPGGVSSSAGSAAAGIASAAGGAVGGAAGSVAGTTVMMGAAASGAAYRNENITSSIANQTRIGRAITNNKQ